MHMLTEKFGPCAANCQAQTFDVERIAGGSRCFIFKVAEDLRIALGLRLLAGLGAAGEEEGREANPERGRAPACLDQSGFHGVRLPGAARSRC